MAPAYVRKRTRFVAVGCTHGNLADTKRLDEVIAFVDRFKPDVRFDLGDVMDTAAFRSGARGTKDESEPVRPDNLAAVEWMRRYQPTHIAWGNHDWRLVEWQGHPNAALSYAASIVWGHLEDEAKRLHAKTVPYHITKGWFEWAGSFWGHGYMFGENALRDHAEMLGGPVNMAHLHRDETIYGRTRNRSKSNCVGTLADVDKMHYADRQRSKTRWGAGLLFGEGSDKETHSWLVSARHGEPLIFPPGC